LIEFFRHRKRKIDKEFVMKLNLPLISGKHEKEDSKADTQVKRSSYSSSWVSRSLISSPRENGMMAPPPSPTTRPSIRPGSQSSDTSPSTSAKEVKSRTFSLPSPMSHELSLENSMVDDEMEAWEGVSASAPPSTPTKPRLSSIKDSDLALTPRSMKQLHVKLAPLMLPSPSSSPRTVASFNPSAAPPPLPPINSEAIDEKSSYAAMSPATPVFNQFAMVSPMMNGAAQAFLDKEEEEATPYSMLSGNNVRLSTSSMLDSEGEATVAMTSEEMQYGANLGMHFRMSEDEF
jgi:hypothetical protein